MGNEVKSSTEKKKKPLNKKAKFIWFGISLVALFLGIILVKAGVPFESLVVKAIYAVAVLLPLLVAAQKISYERVDENGKKKIWAYIAYYICIVAVIILLPFTLWIDQFIV